jgi:threonine dehydrogenase-like Zn-dependent dehydrogenase
VAAIFERSTANTSAKDRRGTKTRSHDQKTIYGSWVTSIWLMEDLVERIVRWKIHPEELVTDRFPLEKADEAYALMASGKSGKVAVVFDEELR